MIASMLLLAIGLGSTIAVTLDHRSLMGEPVWIKPMKFGYSVATFSIVLAWLISRLRRGHRLGWWLGTVFAVSGVVDVLAVTYAASQGEFSHFSESTDEVTAVVQAMFSVGVTPLLLTTAAIAVILLVQRNEDPAIICALRAGLGLAVAGMISAIVLSMSSGPEPRMLTDATERQVPMVGGHGIGDPDGNGMFLTGWSVTGGDLRVPHFFGLHALPILLLAVAIVVILSRRFAILRDQRVRTRIAVAAALGYTGLFALVFWQAARGQSFAHPDISTIAAFASVAGCFVIAVTGVLVAARNSARVPKATG